MKKIKQVYFEKFKNDLEHSINANGIDCFLGIPDFLLSTYIIHCIKSLDLINRNVVEFYEQQDKEYF